MRQPSLAMAMFNADNAFPLQHPMMGYDGFWGCSTTWNTYWGISTILVGLSHYKSP